MQQGSSFSSGGTFLVILGASCIFISAAGLEPLEQWEKIVESPGEGFNRLAAGPGQDGRTYIVATSYQGSILSWPQDAPAEIARVNPNSTAGTVAWGNGRFVVSQGLQNPILTSTNALDWTPVAGVFATDVVFGNGVFVGYGRSGILRSMNGLDWTEITPTNEFYRGKLFWAGGKFIISGSSWGATLQSLDGLEWQAEETDAFQSVYSIGYGEGRYVAMGITMVTNVLVSPDAIQWQPVSILDIMRPQGIAWGNGYFVTVGGSARAYSPDGISWTQAPSGVTEYRVIFSNGRFIAAGYGAVHQSGEVVSLGKTSEGGIEILGAANKNYEVQSRDELSDTAEWMTRASFQMPENSVYRWEDATPSDSHRFYRVRQAGD